MKYSILFHKNTSNFGDDVQSYAISKLIPHADYYVVREEIDSFVSENNEPVATIMAAWWMWKKWNWPPSECIIPKLVSMHFNNYSLREKASPISNEWLTGIGKEYFDAYGPVGVRDEPSLELMNEMGIDAYLSGCITLTLPKQKQTDDKGTYVVLVDLEPKIKQKVTAWLEGNGLEIREFSHHCNYKSCEISYEERLKRVEDALTLYQNAKFVVTQRLHATLPCIAMEVPVFSIIDLSTKRNKTRWYPYCEWVNFMTEEEVLNGEIPFDNKSLAENKTDFLEMRENLKTDIKAFIDEMEALPDDVTAAQIKKTAYTAQQARQWQFSLMKETLAKWLHSNRKIVTSLNEKSDELSKRKEQYRTLKEKYAISKQTNAKLKAKNTELKENVHLLKAQLKEATREPTFKELMQMLAGKFKSKLKFHRN